MQKPTRQRFKERAKPREEIPLPEEGVKVHHIGEWMEHREKTVADMVEALDVDKSQVYRWINKGQKPHNDMFVRIAAFLEADPPDALLRHPLDDWMSRFFQGRSEKEAKAIMEMMEKAWPRTGTDG